MLNREQKTASLSTETPEKSIKISIAETPAEKREIYRFRYQTYVEEMSKHIKGIDYTNKLLFDDMDDWGLILCAKVGSELIGTARINIGKIKDFSKEVATFLSLKAFQDCYTDQNKQKFSFVTKIMVHPSYRNSPVFYMLIAKCYELAYSNQIYFIFGICNYHLIRIYEKLGMHRYCKNFELSGYGLQAPIVLLVNDIQHLRNIHSPFYRIARQRGTLDTQSVEWFHEKFTKHSRFVNSQLITEEDLWSILCNRLGYPPNEAITILHELSVIEAKKFLHCCASLIPFDPENMLVNQGDVSYSYNILISGKLRSLTFLRPVKEYSIPGQRFGANGLTEHNKHTEDIIAIDSGEILILSGIAFQRFYHTHPEVAHKITKRTINLRGKSES
ncbi:hypothetical protein SPFL3102_03179 [Sporomusaceae bacterium FL31]|nr:hypothetical protein SPFL3101_00865 [Sporomusaceae bacterium FL31]GCE35343.1 hypothetical protein SPFL3102_03179 [Sporomusaceae bacterium]